MGMRRKDRELYWRSVLERQAASGMSVAEFCRQESISPPGFYAWRRKIRERDEPASTSLNSSSERRESHTGIQLFPVRVEPSSPPAAVRILLPHGVYVETAGSLDQSVLTEVLRALGEAAAC